MTVLPSQLPGRRERHLLRKRGNQLFPEAERRIAGEDGALQEAQRLDHEELVEFITRFRTLVHETVNLKSNEESDVILEIKEHMDKAYEQAAGLADEQSETKKAIVKLLDVIMQAVWKGAGDDIHARDALEQEEAARATHFTLLNHPLVADLLYPDSPISESELLPTLLTAPADEVRAAMGLFNTRQLEALCQQGREFLDLLKSEAGAQAEAEERLAVMEAELASTVEQPPG